MIHVVGLVKSKVQKAPVYQHLVLKAEYNCGKSVKTGSESSLPSGERLLPWENVTGRGKVTAWGKGAAGRKGNSYYLGNEYSQGKGYFQEKR